MTTWEYKTSNILLGEHIDSILNRRGEEGWELVAFNNRYLAASKQIIGYTAIFKRTKKLETKYPLGGQLG